MWQQVRWKGESNHEKKRLVVPVLAPTAALSFTTDPALVLVSIHVLVMISLRCYLQPSQFAQLLQLLQSGTSVCAWGSWRGCEQRLGLWTSCDICQKKVLIRDLRIWTWASPVSRSHLCLLITWTIRVNSEPVPPFGEHVHIGCRFKNTLSLCTNTTQAQSARRARLFPASLPVTDCYFKQACSWWQLP